MELIDFQLSVIFLIHIFIVHSEIKQKSKIFFPNKNILFFEQDGSYHDSVTERESGRIIFTLVQ